MYLHAIKRLIFIIIASLTLLLCNVSYSGINNLAPKSLNAKNDGRMLYEALIKNLNSPDSTEPLLDGNIVDLFNLIFEDLVSTIEADTEIPIIDIDKVFNTFLEKCIQITDAFYGSILLLNKDQTELQFSYFTGPASEKLRYITLPSETGISGQVLKSRKPIIVNQNKIEKITSMIDDLTKLETNNLFCFPIIINDQIIGVIELINKKDNFTKADVESVNKLLTENLKEIEDAVLFQKQKELFLKDCLSLADEIERKNLYTRGHVRRVKKFALMIANEMGLSNNEIEEIQISAILHDIGKIKTPEYILNKTTNLTDKEFTIMKSHARLGLEYLYTFYVESVRFKKILNRFVNFRNIVNGVYLHHERPDGKGYPLGLFGDKIPRIAKIIAVADTFDALTSDRPYHKGISFNDAIRKLIAEKEKQVCHEVVDALIQALGKEKNIQTSLLIDDLIQEALFNDSETSQNALENLSNLGNVKAKRFDRDYLINQQREVTSFWELNYILGKENATFILDSLIRNSLNYGEGDAVIIIRSIERNKIKLIIQDNGNGFDLNQLAPRILVLANTQKQGYINQVESNLWKLMQLVISEHKGKIIISSQNKSKVFTPYENSWNSITSETEFVTEGLRIEIDIPFIHAFSRKEEERPITLSSKFNIAS